MNASPVDIKAESFPWQVKLLGIFFLIGGIGSLITIWWLGVILLTAGLLVLTLDEGTEIDPQAKTYREYTSYFFIRKGEKKVFDGVEKIFINSSRASRKMYTAHTLDSSTFVYVEYNAYMKFRNGQKIFLTSSGTKDKLIERLSQLGQMLNAPLIDQTVL